ncbi:hypothetical protein SAMN04487967_0596 [Natronorubrum sediminis]|uniref:Uncharacterized protein n=1 Tax=Natronorubrum sediminis TaxID=640943 RepID=A0A1H6FM57_9EURY|nr:DUF5791 family protein [Natronorubrum sediminis]SEH11971.1 hypothetical protein SAMN04487967_0596 [Natronorubrum sediminis]
MFYEQRMQAPESPAGLREEYLEDLRSIVNQHGVETVVEATDVDENAADAIHDGDDPDLLLSDVAQIHSLEPDEPAPDELVTIACEHLLLGMSTAVLDVDAIESELALELDAKEIQQKLEQRSPMTLEEFVHIQYVIVDGAP